MVRYRQEDDGLMTS